MDTQLGAVYLKGVGTDIRETSECPGGLGPVDFTNISADVIIGNTYDLNYSVITCTTQFSTCSAAWIDYNQNQVFDHFEQIMPYSKRFGVQTYSFKVPLSTSQEIVKPGLTRLRVQVQETSANDIDPCMVFSYGGTKDFGIEIKPTLDGGWSVWSTCNASCGGGWQLRQCNNPTPSTEGAPCSGENIQECNTQACTNNAGKIAAGVLVPLVILGGLVGYFCYRKRQNSGEMVDDFAAHSSEPPVGQSYQTDD